MLLPRHQHIGLFETESVEPEFDEFDDRWLLRGDTVEMHPDSWQYANPASEWCGRSRMWLE
jgi:hypothetical protein